MFITRIISERKANGEMESGIAPKTGMDEGEIARGGGLVGGIDGLHTEVEAENEIIEVEPKANAIAKGYLLPEIT